MIESLFSMTPASTELTLTTALMSIFVSLALGAIISFTYRRTQPDYSPSFTLTMLVLPVIVAIIILLIGNNIARAFSLAGAFSIIRFRSAPGDSKDISFVLFTMAGGLAVGVGSYGYAFLFTLILCLVMLLLRYFQFGTRKLATKMLKITIPENLGYEEALDEVFRQFKVQYDLRKIRTTELGSLYELVYAVNIDPQTNQKEFLDALRCRNGNLDITLTMNPPADN